MLLARSLVESTTGRRTTVRTNGNGVGEDWTRWLGRSSAISLARYFEEQIASLDLEADHGNHLGNAAGPLGVEGCLHLHGLDREQLLAFSYPVARRDRHADDQTRERRADLVGVGRIDLGGLTDGRGQRAVENLGLAGLAIELEEDGALAVGVRLSHGQELDDQGLPLLDLELDLRARLGPEEERRRGQDRGVRIGPLVGGQIGEDARIEY